MTEITEVLFKCRGKCGQMLPESAFPQTAPYKDKRYRYSKCRECRNREKWRKRRIPISTVRPHLLEIIHRTGSIRSAAKALETDYTTVRVWLGTQPRYYKSGKKQLAKNISRSSAAHILTTLRHLRLANVHYSPKPDGPKPYWYSVDNKEAERGRKRREAS